MPPSAAGCGKVPLRAASCRMLSRRARRIRIPRRVGSGRNASTRPSAIQARKVRSGINSSRAASATVRLGSSFSKLPQTAAAGGRLPLISSLTKEALREGRVGARRGSGPLSGGQGAASVSLPSPRPGLGGGSPTAAAGGGAGGGGEGVLPFNAANGGGGLLGAVGGTLLWLLIP